MIDRSAVIKTVRRLLRPMIRLMIGLGINARDFVEIVKMVYADVALQEGGEQGQATTLSGASRITGLTRREVTRLRGVLEKVPLDMETCRGPVERVLEAWHTDPRYVAQDGQPLQLERSGHFAELINEHRGVLSAAALIGELKTHRLIRIAGDEVTVQCRYLPADTLMSTSLTHLGSLIEVIGTSMSSEVRAQSVNATPFAGYYVSEQSVMVSADEVREYMDRQAAELLEHWDDCVDGRASADVSAGRRLRIGVFAMQEHGPNPKARRAQGL